MTYAEQNQIQKQYKKYCSACHGNDGKKMFNDAPDLSVSELNLQERMSIIRNGKGTMVGYKGILSDQEIQEIAEYTLQFRE